MARRVQGSGSGESGHQLSRREERILCIVVERFVTSGEPVGSRTISKTEGEHLSAASIRNTLADLEEMGYLYQPYTSAGRVPTDLGYRYYVDRLMQPPTLPLAERREIEAFFTNYRGIMGSILENTSKLLSRYSHYIGIVSAPQFESTVFCHIDFVLQAPGRVLVIFVSQSGIVHNKLIEVDFDMSQEELSRISSWVVEHFRGKTLTEVRNRVADMLQRDRAALDSLARRALFFSEASFIEGFGEEGIYIEGTANIFSEPEFADMGFTSCRCSIVVSAMRACGL